MAPATYAYSSRPTRNPFRYALAVWRLIRRDPEQAIDEAAIVEIGFARSRLGRRFARWEQTVAALESHPQTARALSARRPFGPIALEDLADCPAASLGGVFFAHCSARSIDPNLVRVPPNDEVGWLLNHMYQTHDIWHVVTGWGNDLPGEVGLAGFYCAQFKSPAFFGYLLALIIFNVISRRADLDAVLAAFSAGYRAGRRAEALFGVAWDELWDVPIAELRARFEIDHGDVLGEGIPAAA